MRLVALKRHHDVMDGVEPGAENFLEVRKRRQQVGQRRGLLPHAGEL